MPSSNAAASHGMQMTGAYGAEVAGGAARLTAARLALRRLLLPGSVALGSDLLGMGILPGFAFLANMLGALLLLPVLVWLHRPGSELLPPRPTYLSVSAALPIIASITIGGRLP